MAKKFKTIGGKKYFRQAFAIPGKAGKPDTWKLPHHGPVARPHDELPVDWARLPGAATAAATGEFRGRKLDATTAERKRAARHVLSHYRQAEKDPPESLLEFLGLEESMKRRIGKGKPLTELVKGSLDYTLRQIRDAFMAQFNRDDTFYPWIAEVFEGYVVVEEKGLATGEYYRVTYEKRDGEYVFAPRDEWEVVELTYQPQTMTEAIEPTPSGAGGTEQGTKPREERLLHSDSRRTRNPKGTKRFTERIDGTVRLEEAVEGQPRYISGTALTADVVNANNRRYRTPIVRGAVREMQHHLHESAGQGRMAVVGEAEHPSDKRQRPQYLETIVRWETVDFDDATGEMDVRGRILETAKGKDAIAIMEGGVLPGLSIRGYGHSKYVEKNGRTIEDVTELTLTGIDLVSPWEQSDPGPGVTMLESKERNMDPQEILELMKESGLFDSLKDELQRKIQEAMQAEDEERQVQALREALGIGPKDDLLAAVQERLARTSTQGEQEPPEPESEEDLEANLRQMLGLEEGDDLQEMLQARQQRMQELEEAERQRQVAEYIEEQTADLPYPDFLKERLVEALTAQNPASVEAAGQALTEKRQEYDAIVAQLRLAARGFGQVEVTGPVLESETGVPEFARGAHLLTEAMVRAGHARPRKWNRDPADMSANERFARLYLERFDQNFKAELLREAKLIEEAEQTSDLSLPYSVARAVIAEAVPQLVAVSIFDVGLTDRSPTRIYFEKYEHETGVENDVVDENVTITTLDTWYDLAHQRLQPGTVVVQDDTDTTTYTEGTDYVIDYGEGKILALSGGSISATDVSHDDYTYDAIREGEMAPIKRGKQTLSYKTLEIMADRLATQISSEVVEFARSQLSYDATGRTLAGLVRRIRETIDQHLLWMGLTAALSVANNSGGTWSATPGGDDTYDQNLDKLFRYVGVAKVKVANRYYEPNFILSSMTIGDVMSNSKQFTAAGKRPDADLDAAGYVGRAKGLPVFSSTQFSDGYLLVGNRELVMHRVFRALQLKGPYPSYDSSGELIAADQYYCEEYNGTDAPVPEKGAYVVLTS
jgi:hypothetical protein